MNINFGIKSKNFPTLKLDEVHIWSASLLENENDLAYYISILSEDERERSIGFRFSKDQKQFIISRGILRCLLAKYLGQTPERIEIIYGLWGKPCVVQENSLRFNVSHSRNYALYAMASNYEVGIDLEYRDKSLILEDLALHMFSAAELTDWKNLDPQGRANSFFRCWASNEAFLKASGKGWLEDKKGLTFNFQNELRKGNLHDEVTNPYYFECISGYASALFVDGPLLYPSYFEWNQSSFNSLKN